MVAAVAAFSFASCGGNKTNDSAAEADSTAVVAQAEAAADEATAQLDAVLAGENADPAKVKEALDGIKAKVEELQAAGDTEAAAAYASKVKEYIEEHADAIKNADPSSLTVLDLVNAAANLPQSAKDAASDAANAVTSDVDAAKAAGKAAVEGAADAAKAAATEKVTEAKENAEAAAKAKVDETKQAAKDKADAAVQKGAQKASNAVNKALGL